MAEWICKKCKWSTQWDMRDVADRGTPVCKDCDEDMILKDGGELFDGQNIVSINTINSMYANGRVQVIDDKGNILMMSTNTIAQMANDYMFRTEKKRKYTYLIDPEIVDTAER